LETVVDRALAVAQSPPAGPVYLTLPREVLAERLGEFEYWDPPRLTPAADQAPDPAAVAAAAGLLAAAERPLAIVKSSGRDGGAVSALVALAEALAMPVVEHFSTHLCFPQSHPLYLGSDPGPYLRQADLVLVVDADVPWIPDLEGPAPEARIIQVAEDPLFARYPIRGFAVDVGLAGAPRLTLAALREAVLRVGLDPGRLAARRGRWEAEHARLVATWAERARAVREDRPIDATWLSRCVGEVVDEQTLVINEYDLDLTQTALTVPGSYFGQSPASGLGWALGAALGAKLAAPDRTVVCCVGDGAYLFGVPTAAHWVSRAYRLPVLFVVFNNRAWNAVKRAVVSHAPEGWAVRTGVMPWWELDPAPDYELICRACGGWAERVEDPGALTDALRRALGVVREEGRQALLNVVLKKP
jgi:acetolactate synthase-1/2/3 large subunit